MSEFDNVSIIKNANIYFDGKVTSRSIRLSDGSEKTLGIMLPGEYEFSTNKKEIMDIMSGELAILLQGENTWKAIKAGESFEVPAKSKFAVKIKSITDYCCSFVDE